MIYDFICSKCSNIQEDSCKVDDRETHSPSCEKCGSPCSYTFTPSMPEVVFKDGPSGSWPSKGNRFQTYRRKQSEKMAKRQRDRYGPEPNKAVPNFNGVETESWREAQELAKQKIGPHAASTFTEKVSKEKPKV